MDSDARIAVRPACRSDLQALASLEERVWGAIGHPPVSSEVLTEWMDVNPSGFLVATDEAVLRGYVYVEAIQFHPMHLECEAFSELAATGHLRTHHVPDGNAFYGVSIVTDPPGGGVGKLLLREVIALAEREGKEYVMTFSRMPGCAAYLSRLPPSVIGNGGPPKETLALSYAAQCIALVQGDCAPHITVHGATTLHPVTVTDPVLSFFSIVLGMSLYGIVPTPLPDPASADFAALMVRAFR